MNALIKKYTKAGLDPVEMWNEEGEGGVMVKAIRNSREARVTQRVFDRLQLPDNFNTPKAHRKLPRKKAKRSHKAQDEIEVEDEDDDESDAENKHKSDVFSSEPTSITLDNDSRISFHFDQSAFPNATLGSLTVTIDRPSGGLTVSGSVQGTVFRLHHDKQLQSTDIARYTELFPIGPGWHIFEPGYPFKHSIMSSRELLATNFIFILNDHHHWSVCHLDQVSCRLHHYNSAEFIAMPIDRLKKWAEGQAALGITQDITIVEQLQLRHLRPEAPISEELGPTLHRMSYSSSQRVLEDATRHAAAPKVTPSEEAKLTDQGQSDASPRFTNLLAQATRAHFDTFLASRKRLEDQFTQDKEKLATQSKHVSEMQSDLEDCRGKLERAKDTTQDLQKRIRSAEATVPEMRQWLSQCPKSNDDQNKWTEKLVSNTESVLAEMMADLQSLRDEINTSEMECMEYNKNIERLEPEIRSAKMVENEMTDHVAAIKGVLDDMPLHKVEHRI
ncbi:hypothetical protein FSARC_14040 [Fusarium sarcochroum]|uniref:Uncharacterized protein n=1 Tax=Fusarium sarcochroum TaxID=1208366 RepID=A0A8H4WRF1_9HYPO|nr:hypothetical protein FSARC_14040 [Fusarium sarcochroum]